MYTFNNSRTDAPAAPSKTLMLLETRALPELGAFFLMQPWLAMTRPGDGHPVLVLPGLLADDQSTGPLRGFLNLRGYAVHGWKLGRNLGLRENVEANMIRRIEELFERYDHRKISLVGWSLGGLYARQLAKLVPEKIRSMISLGSPFAGAPHSTNAWQAYELAAGRKVSERDLLTNLLADAPPVPTTSIFSRSDGVCAWKACLNVEGPQAENIEVYGSHLGLGHHPSAVYAVADRLAQAEGAWKKFAPPPWWALSYPDWRRA